MSVTLVKQSGAGTVVHPGVGMNHGMGPVEFIGGFPVKRLTPRPARRKASGPYVTGGRVHVCGVRINARRVRSLDINGPGGTMWVLENGGKVPAGGSFTVGDWFRFLLDSGTFAGIDYLR